MLINKNQSIEKRKFIIAIFIPAILSVLMALSFVLEWGMDWDFHKAGIFPRQLENLVGVFTYIFIHGSIEHLLNNLLAFFILSSCLYYFYNEIASKILISSYLISGVLLWFIGRDSWHIGASGLIYALAFYLALSGIFRKHIPLIAISFIVILVYGNIVWHVVPWQANDPVSWEGHLSGLISGLVLAVITRKQGPQKPVKTWEDDGEEIEWFEDENEENTSTEETENKHYEKQ